MDEITRCRRVGVVIFDRLRDDEAIVFVEGNEMPVEGGVVGCGEAQAVFRIEAATQRMWAWSAVVISCKDHLPEPSREVVTS